MKSPVSVIIGVAAVAFVAAPLTSFAGGTIAGKVTYSGKSEQKEFSLAKFPNPKFCAKNPKKGLVKGDTRIMPTIEVGKDGGLKNAVVFVTDIEDKAFVDGYQGTEVTAVFCEFLPFAGVVVKKKPFKVENTDADPDDPKSVLGVLHNPHSFVVKGSSSSTEFNIGLAKKGDKLNKIVKLRKKGADKKGYFRLQCDQHEFMQSFFLPVWNPYFAVVQDDGSFEIKDVPPGKHKVVAWHPFVGKGKRVEFDVEVTDGGTANLEAKLK